MKLFKTDSISLLFIFVAYLTNSNLAHKGKKRVEDVAELSVSQPNKRQHLDASSSSVNFDEPENNGEYNPANNYKKVALELFNNIDIFELDCSSSELSKYTETTEEEATIFLKSCESQAQRWIYNKKRRLDDHGTMIDYWFTTISRIFKIIKGNINYILNDDIRKFRTEFKTIFQSYWLNRRSKTRKGIDDEAFENFRRVIYFGEGICVHIQEPPFDKIETFMEVALRDFQRLQYVKNLTQLPDAMTSLKIYILQKICRKSYNMPQNPKKETIATIDIYPMYSSTAKYTLASVEKHLFLMDRFEQGDKCDWLAIFRRIEAYRIVNNLEGGPHFIVAKELVDSSIDALIMRWLKKSPFDFDDQVYRRIRDLQKRKLVKEVARKLSKAIGSSNLPLNKSINSALDIRSPSSFRQQMIKNVDLDSNIELGKIYIDLLAGKLGDLSNGIFIEPVYKDKQSIEYKSLEFLSHIFSIKGYKPSPEIESPVLDFYYLYKISEMCNMMPVKGVAHLANSRMIVKKVALDLIKSINTYEFDCTPELLVVKNQEKTNDEMTEYLKSCDKQVQEWLKIKVFRLANFGSITTLWLKGIGKYITENETNLNRLLNEDMRDDFTFAIRMRNAWEYRESEKYKGPIEEETLEAMRRVFFDGDGVCPHFLEPPFDRVEKYMEVVLRDFQHLDYVKNFIHPSSLFPTPDSLKIYAFQKLCRKFFEKRTGKLPEGPSIDNIVDIHEVEPEVALSILAEHTEKINNEDRDYGYKCNKFGVYSRKQQYHVLNNLKGEENYLLLKKGIDESLDEFVSHCLTIMYLITKNGDEIYERVNGKPIEHLLPIVVSQLWLARTQFKFPLDQSINNMLDVRSSNNEYKKLLLKVFEETINDTQDLKLIRLFTGLMLGRLGDFTRGVFREPIYKNHKTLVEFELLEFLFNIFSIKGYMPGANVTNPLIDYYYLYKINEIFQMIPVDKSIEFNMLEFT